MNRRILISLTLALASLVAWADEVKFTAKAPQTVVAEQPFQLQFVVSSDDVSKLQVGKLDGFEVLNGPSTYTSQSYQFINGKSSHSVTTTYTYLIMGKKAGQYSISPATVVVGGKTYKSNALSIKVLPPDSKQQSQSSGGGQATIQKSQTIDSESLFIRAHLSKNSMREQEMATLTYKLYAKVDVVNLSDIKLPDFQGLMTHDIEVQNAQNIENYNGQNYVTYILKQMLISPQKSGKITISPLKCDVVVRQRQTVRDPRSFFGSYSTYQDVKKQISTSAVTLNVSPLPEPKPANFSGAVGSLSMTSSISATEVDANNSVTLKINIKGQGNLKLIPTPKVEFPTDFEQYDPKVDNQFSVRADGFSASKTIEYLVIPRHNGTFEIPAVELSYFDLPSKSYKTLRTEAYTLKVNKGTGSSQSVVYSNVDKESVKQIATDIQYIKYGDLRIKPKAEPFAGSLKFWLAMLLPLIVAITLGLVFQKKARENANLALVRNKKANKVATKRLRTAQKFLREGKKDSFYDEILSALWLYLSDKLNIPISALNKDNVKWELGKRSVQEELSEETLRFLTECEFHRYSSSEEGSAMDKTYRDAIQLIGDLENTIKR